MRTLLFALTSIFDGSGAWILVGLIVVGIVVMSLLVGKGSAKAPSNRGAFRNDAAGKNIRTAGSADTPKEVKDLDQ